MHLRVISEMLQKVLSEYAPPGKGHLNSVLPSGPFVIFGVYPIELITLGMMAGLLMSVCDKYVLQSYQYISGE